MQITEDLCIPAPFKLILGTPTDGQAMAQLDIQPMGKIYYADSVKGRAGAGGQSPADACLTLAEATAKMVSYDTLVIRGSFNEAVTITGLTGLRFIGAGPTTNQALWTAPDNATCLTLAASPDCLVEGIRFRPPKYTEGEVTPAGVALTGVSHQTIIRNCRFQGKSGSWYGIFTDGAQANVQILGNQFVYLNTATYGTAIKGTMASALAECTMWVIKGNTFHSNLNHIACVQRMSQITENWFGAEGVDPAGAAQTTVLGIDIHGTAGAVAANVVTLNWLGGLYHQACYYPAGETDAWKGNWCEDRTHTTQVDATTGISKAAPAA